MDKNIFEQITKEHSTTFYYASLLFPKKIRNDVFILYAFLRRFDDVVDETNDKKEFIRLKNILLQSLKEKKPSGDLIIDAFVRLFYQYRFKMDYLDAFFYSLEKDLKKPLEIKTEKGLIQYAYGVAGVVGLMMAKIIQLPHSLYPAAKEFGELMQIANILRDIREDFLNRRVYIPKEVIVKYQMQAIDEHQQKPENFAQLIRSQIEKLKTKFDSLKPSIELIPSQYQRSIKIAYEIYLKILKKIEEDPLRVWRERVRVSKFELGLIILKNLI
jgi:phytoene synthase